MNGSSNVTSALAGTALTRHTCYSRENPYSDALGSPSPHLRKVFDAAVVAEQFLGSVSMNRTNVSQSSDSQWS